MIERAIENWLINTNERNYQIPFCQVLISKGYEILYISPHGQLEFGKDIIVKTPEGDTIAYQLKGGDITLAEFRKIMGELYELIDTKCDHPNVDKSKPHKAYLVTNGDIKDDVFQRIDKINNTETHYTKLETINKNQLLKYFLEGEGVFLPQSFEAFGIFLSFFTEDGKDFIPKQKYFNFIANHILVRTGQKSNKLNSVFSSVILTSYLLKNYQDNNNFFAQFEAWSILYSTIISYLEEIKLSNNKIKPTLKIILEEINECLNSIFNEFMEKENLLEGNALGDGGIMYRVRTTIVLGVVTLYCRLNHNSDDPVKKKITEHLKYAWYWGESSFPYWFNIIKYFEMIDEDAVSQDYIKEFIKATLQHNGSRNKDQAYPSVYYDSKCILNSIFQLEPIEYNQFKGRSFVLEPLISMATRRDLKDFLQTNWRKITHMQFEEFLPDTGHEIFNWHNTTGTNHTDFPKQTESYEKLKKKYSEKMKLKVLNKYSEFIPIFCTVYPQRINEKIIRFIDTS
ncbi:MAG: hypothetical protein KAT05_16525 [Spirochaetes bacterium]|nr:hypothetical protein [Spirochaetota bacterium]